MARPLVTAKIQSVKEIKKKAKIRKWNKFLTILILVIVILAIVACFAYNFYVKQKQEFSETELDITFYSNDFPVKDSLAILEQSEKVTLMFVIDEKDSDNVSEFSEMLSNLTFVLGSQGKKLTHIVNISKGKTILSCTTNYGDLYTDEEISSSECLNLISEAEALFVLNYPKTNLKQSSVYLNALEKNIYFESKDLVDLSNSVYLVLKAMYPNMEEILKDVYEISANIGSDLSDIKKDYDSNVLEEGNDLEEEEENEEKSDSENNSLENGVDLKD